MTEAVQSLQALLGRISSFFDIFDLSFIVSGATSLAALCLYYKLHAPGGFPEWLASVYGGILFVLGCYVLGMLSFILGRLLRRIVMRVRGPFLRRQARQISHALREHNIWVKDDDRSMLALCISTLLATPAQDTASKPSPAKGKKSGAASDESAKKQTDESETKRMEQTAHRLYTLLWTQVRQQHDLSPSHVLLNRYWVMAALCDGMVVASLLWLGVVVCSWSRLSAMQLGFMGNLGIALSAIAVVLFVREAERYTAVQIDDLISTLAWDRSRPPSPPAQVQTAPSSPNGAASVPSPAAASLSGQPTQ
ncbi:MAG TPA: hypothetical protein PK493_20440 [Pseudomonadota bacterium]|nr:hypothetical protein [Pseudomonadota bacterium]